MSKRVASVVPIALASLALTPSHAPQEATLVVDKVTAQAGWFGKSMIVEWEAPPEVECRYGSPCIDYRIMWRQVGDSSWPRDNSAYTEQTRYRIPGLTEGSWEVRVRARMRRYQGGEWKEAPNAIPMGTWDLRDWIFAITAPIMALGALGALSGIVRRWRRTTSANE